MPPVPYRFGRFVFDVDARQLLADGREIHLSPKAFTLLDALIRHRARAVSKRELQETLWPNTFVEETNLASLIAEIRRAIGDSATEPAFLRTVHRFGYRFVGEILESEALPAAAVRTRPCLVVDNRQVILLEGVNVIGRAPDAAVRCEAPGVSRYHARIVVSNGEATLEDLGSKNGTYVRRDRISSARLSDGDEIGIGSIRMTFYLQPPLEPTETVVVEPDQ
jgi:DNA-binding winged helix-turn-helix (wHTH) protein